MALDVVITGANLDAGGNLKVSPSLTPATMGGVRVFSENDTGALTGSPHLVPPETSQDFRLRLGQDTTLFQETFNATAQVTSNWKHVFATMTMTQSGGFLNVNAAGTSTASGNHAYLQTWQYFPLWASGPICAEFVWYIDRAPLANETWQQGFGLGTAAADPIDGIWLELTASGLQGCARFNSGTRAAVTLEGAGITPIYTNRKYFIIAGTREIEFWIDDVLAGRILVNAIQGTPIIGISLPFFIQKFNAGVVASSPNVIPRMAYVNITQMDLVMNKPWAESLATTGLSAAQGQSGGTMGGTQFWANSTNPTTALPVNTALTANLPTGLSGQGVATLWNLAATDMVMTQFTVPLGGVNQTPRKLVIKGVRISAAAFTAAWTAPAAGQHLLMWGIAWGTTAVTLAQAESGSFTTATVKAFRRKALGLMGWVTGTAAIGTPADKDIVVKLDVPIVVYPGENVDLVCKMLNGAATATGGLFFTYDLDAYYE